jgi:hypothetical protein
MKLLSFIAYGEDTIKPVYCNKVVKNVLPFTHGKVDIVAGTWFGAQIVEGRTVLTIKPDAGASEAPAFKVPYPSKVREAIQGLRAAACAAVYQAQAEGTEVCLS